MSDFPKDGWSMADLFEPRTPPNLGAPAPRRCLHPSQYRRPLEDGGSVCTRCGRDIAVAATRRGRSSRRLGHDQERRAERVYGWEKIGERGSITDLRGTLMKVQQKATRGTSPGRWRGIFRELDTVADGRVPALLLSFVRAGVPTEDYVVLRGSDWLQLHGKDEPGGIE